MNLLFKSLGIIPVTEKIQKSWIVARRVKEMEKLA